MEGADDRRLHASDIESLERRIMELALERTGASSGAVFLWDEQARGLSIDFHVVDGVTVNLPNAVIRKRRDGRRNGIALWIWENNKPYLCHDSSTDPHYAPYFLDVGSVAGAPIPYQGRAIGAITVSSRKPQAFGKHDLAKLEELAASSAKFLRRAQLYRASSGEDTRPFLIKGLCPEWLEVERRLERVAPTDAPVLVTGESGTGKELVAHSIHFNSRRANKPIVTVNCAAIPETMLESTLFGHVRGAFTGASFDKLGELSKAHQGTLFLDEVGELPMALQTKVLRAVEQGEVQPLGSNRPTEHVDVRLIAATNRNLPAMVENGEFRDDLYYRLSVMTLELPPLRRYKDNLEVLARVFVRESAERHGKPVSGLSTDTLARLAAYDFPGNVRELKNAIEHAVIMAAGGEVQADDLPSALRSARPVASRQAKPAKPRTLRQMREQWLAPLEREYLLELLDGTGGNVSQAARRAGINPVTLYRLLKKRGLSVRRQVASR